MTRVLAAVAVLIATVALVVALNRPEPTPARQQPVSFELPPPSTEAACVAAGGVWVTEDDGNPMSYDPGACAGV